MGDFCDLLAVFCMEELWAILACLPPDYLSLSVVIRFPLSEKAMGESRV